MRLIVVVVLISLVVAVLAFQLQYAKTAIEVKTGSWSYEIIKAEAKNTGHGRGVCLPQNVTVSYTENSVTVVMYGCQRVLVDIMIRSKATVPLCLIPKGPAEGPGKIPLAIGATRTVNYVFHTNGTLTFERQIGDCGR